jgi:gamma-glutamylcysteine synthetase
MKGRLSGHADGTPSHRAGSQLRRTPVAVALEDRRNPFRGVDADAEEPDPCPPRRVSGRCEEWSSSMNTTTTAAGPGAEAGPISEAEAEEHVSGICFKHGPPRRVGIELEWLVHDAADPARPVGPDRLAAAFAAAERRTPSGQMTLEPGGQWELSSQPAGSLAECLAATDRDLDSMAAAAAGAGLRLTGYGTEPHLPPLRTLDLPRYAAMEEFFDRSGRWGRVMMCSTASVQVNLDAGLADGDLTGREAARGPAGPDSLHSPDGMCGPDGARDTSSRHILNSLDGAHSLNGSRSQDSPCGSDGAHGFDGPDRLDGLRESHFPHNPQEIRPGPDGARCFVDPPGRSESHPPRNPLGQRERWDLLHDLGPVLVAAFANSPLLGGRPTGWRSTRQAVWARLDPSRTLAPPLPARAAGTGADAAGIDGLRTVWTDYVLNAEVLCIQSAEGPWAVPHGVTFRDWLRAPGPNRPTRADLDYHLTTLFPPVRPKGHLELRVVDAQQGGDWRVVAAVVTALLDDPVAADAARAALEPLRALTSLAAAEPLASGAAGRGPRGALWLRAARHGPADPDLRAAAESCFDLALAALPRLAAPARTTDAVAAFAERYVRRGRCPADDLLDERSGRGGRPHPRRAEEISWS